MGKKSKSSAPAEEHLILPHHPARVPGGAPIVDTHTHLISTFTAYRSKYKAGKHTTVFDFVREVYRGHGVDAIVDVYCEAPEHETWREIADSALTEEDRKEKWGGLEYWFVMGAFAMACSSPVQPVDVLARRRTSVSAFRCLRARSWD